MSNNQDTLVVYTYENLKTYTKHVAERKTYVSRAVEKAQQVLLYGASFFGFSSAGELDVWCTKQFRRVDTILRPIVDKSYNMRNSVVLKKMSIYFCSMFPLFGSHANKRTVQDKDYQDEAASSKTRVKLRSSLPAGQETKLSEEDALASKRQPKEYDDSTWLALMQDDSSQRAAQVPAPDSDVLSAASAHLVPPNIFSSSPTSSRMLIPEFHNNREVQADANPIRKGRTYAF